ncbi:helix-turn-helix domain-containing protein [Priestia aryabhattai]|jgi:transcriptional regulator with XRE-family HTH domain|uniref:helix-turn-helix transcriptional regulator n=1 Tax=Priestia aryabhattai TaxID=412384 RepID=UPI001EC97258|nr:helix-turn-helix transcriptional regulator [Priestia aryabhattai]MBY0094302.1 helix-turn-helix domain-containing protein [Priestia aryabhattai]MBY0103617.1 helix-turn-helix domain-containing protein [Priestia aryabhattai]
MLSDKERRRELGDFLKVRRERLSPGDFNLPIGARRRAKGLRREEVSQLAGIGVTWYTWLEQGRDIQVSSEVLEAISRIFTLNKEEKEHLFLLGNQPLSSTTVQNERENIDRVVKNLLSQLGHCPAYVTDEKLNIVDWNKAAIKVFGDFNEMDERNRNAVWRCFTSKEYQNLFQNWEDHAQRLIAQFRLAYTRFVGDEWFKTIISELSEESPHFYEWWSNHEVLGTPCGKKTIIHPVVGEMIMDHITLQVYDAPELKVTVYQPRQENETEEKMERLLR